MLKEILVFCVLLLSLSAIGQVKVNAKATGKHQRTIDQVKGAKAQAEQVKQAAESRKNEAQQLLEQLKLRKRYKQQYDSLKSIHSDTLLFDTLQISIFTEKDSLAIAEKILSREELSEYRALMEEVLQLEKSELINADSIALVRAQAVLEEHAQSYLPKELTLAEDPLKGFPSNPLDGGVPDLSDGVPEIEKPSRPNPNLIKPEQAQELFQKIDPEKFQEIQQNIKGLKEKYSSLPDTRFPEEGVKRNSLQDLPFLKRINVSGNFNVQSTDPFILDSNLQLGYWINKKWLSGVGLIIRENFGKRDSLSILTGDSHGFSVYSRYDIGKGFFGWGEMDHQINKSLFPNEESRVTLWEKAYLLGIGREFKIGKVRMSSTILYDFNYKKNNLNVRPLVLKVGIQFTEKPE